MRPVGAALVVVCLLLPARAWAVYWCGGVADSCKCGADNPYPCCENGGGKSGNCTWGAWHMACCNWGVGLPPPWQDAKKWAGNYAAHPDYEVLPYPVVNSIGCRVSSTYGHVAYVTGVGDGKVWVHEQGCCSGCWNGFQDSVDGAGYYDGGYIVRKGQVWVCDPGQVDSAGCGNCGTKHRTCGGNGQWEGWGGCEGQGPCAPGQANTQKCGDCGAQTATCNGSCQWDPFGDCAGPDPGNGNLSCDSGEPGVCAEGRLRCAAGWVTCLALNEPTGEQCDGLDNDCNGKVDDGNPQVIGATPPEFAAAFYDGSYPAAIREGEMAAGWVEFRNVGTQTWKQGSIWLKAAGGSQAAVEMDVPGVWPAWDTPAVLLSTVPPGDIGRLEFVLRPRNTVGHDLLCRLYLVAPDGVPLACPTPDIEMHIQVLAPPLTADAGPLAPDVLPADGGVSPDDGEPAQAPGGGCSTTTFPASTGPLSLLILLVALFVARAAAGRVRVGGN